VFPRDIDVTRKAEPTPVMVVVDAWLDTVPPDMSVRDPQHRMPTVPRRRPWSSDAM
jgi:hypothetical protein